MRRDRFGYWAERYAAANPPSPTAARDALLGWLGLVVVGTLAALLLGA